MGQRGAVALAKRVAAISAIPAEYAGEPGRQCLWSGFAVEFSERVLVWRGPSETGTAHGSLSDRQVRIERRGWAADYGSGFVACGANCDLCGAGDLLHRFGAGTGAL